MTKHKEINSPTPVLEVPEKVGFGNRDCYIVTEAIEQRITYAKNGKGDDDIIWTIEDIKKQDPSAVIDRGDGKVVIRLSQPFDVRTFKAPRRATELTERERKRMNGILEAIAEAQITDDDYTDEDVERKKAELPKVVKYYTDDENERFYVKSENEMWIEEELFRNNANLLLTFVEAYLKTKGIERGSVEYIEKFEDILSFYI